jgi:geranylgeranyl reductase family protein
MIYDVIIVGSGPGGAVAAATLAKRGKSVLLVDRQPFPRDKVCGDGLPGNVMGMLVEGLGIDIKHYGLKHQQIYGIDLVAPSGMPLEVREKPKAHYSMVAPRYYFDNMLHQHAVESGATFEVMEVDVPLFDGAAHAGNGANESLPDPSRKVVGIVQRKGKERIEHEAKVVIAADGAASPLTRAVRGRVSDTQETAVAIRAYGRLTRPLTKIPVVYFKYLLSLVPGYGWVFPTSADTINVGLGLFDQEKFKKDGKNLKELLSEFLHNKETVKTWPIPVWMTNESRVINGMYLVGDAGRFVDALTGGGIYPAMITGQLAGQAGLKQLDGTSLAEAAHFYDEGWRGGIGRSLSKLLLVQRWIGSKPAVFNGIFRVANALPPLRGYLLQSLAGQHA